MWGQGLGVAHAKRLERRRHRQIASLRLGWSCFSFGLVLTMVPLTGVHMERWMQMLPPSELNWTLWEEVEIGKASRPGHSR